MSTAKYKLFYSRGNESKRNKNSMNVTTTAEKSVQERRNSVEAKVAASEHKHTHTKNGTLLVGSAYDCVF